MLYQFLKSLKNTLQIEIRYNLKENEDEINGEADKEELSDSIMEGYPEFSWDKFNLNPITLEMTNLISDLEK